MLKPVTGKQLREDLSNLKITRKPIAEEFLFERDIMLISGDSGIGKSQIVIQELFELTSSKLLFGNINIMANLPTFYLQLEGDYDETIERIRRMEEAHGYKANEDLITIWEKKDLEISDKECLKEFFKELKTDLKVTPQHFIIDPIYKLTALDISKPDGARAIIGFSDRVQLEFECANSLIHHNAKDSFVYTKEGRFQKDDAYYGHSFIKNHVRTSYALVQGDKKNNDSPVMTRKKGRGGDTLAKIELKYNHETGLCEFKQGGVTPLTKFVRAVNKMKDEGRTTIDFNEFHFLSNIPTATLRRLKSEPIFNEHFCAKKGAKNKEIWEVRQALSRPSSL